MDFHVAVLKFSSSDIQGLFDLVLRQEFVHWFEIVAQRWVRALFSDIVQVECWSDWDADDWGQAKLALF